MAISGAGACREYRKRAGRRRDRASVRCSFQIWGHHEIPGIPPRRVGSTLELLRHRADRSVGIQASEWPSRLPAVGTHRPFTHLTSLQGWHCLLCCGAGCRCAAPRMSMRPNNNSSRGTRGIDRTAAETSSVRFPRNSGSFSACSAAAFLTMSGPTISTRPHRCMAEHSQALSCVRPRLRRDHSYASGPVTSSEAAYRTHPAAKKKGLSLLES